MTSVTHVDAGARIASALIKLIHQGAPVAEFAQCLVEAEGLPSLWRGKSTLVESVRMAMAVRERLELHQQRERGLLAVIASAQDLSGRLDFRDLLRGIVSRARNLLGSDLGWLTVLDPERDEFQVLMADGALSRDTSGMVARHGAGVAGVVMATRLPFSTPDYLRDGRFPHDAKLDDTFRNEGIVALVGVPLIWNDEVIGLLFVADRYHRLHTAQSISILCALATHGAVALKNARDFERANVALEKAGRDRAELERHVRSIQSAADAHEQMTSLLARGASLSTLCESVARSLDGSVVVLDEAGQVIGRGAASGYLGSRAFEASRDVHGAALAQALRTGRPVGRSRIAYECDGEVCRVMPVIGGDDVLGSIALFHRGELDEVAIRTFERSSSVIGIVLLSQERMEATKHRGVSTLLRSLVSPRQDEPALLTDRADRHGVDLARPLALMLVEMERPGAGHAARRLRGLPPLANTLIDEIDGVLVVLCGAAGAVEVRQDVVGVVRREMRAIHRGVLSRPVSSPAEIPALYATLRRALPVLGRIGVDGHVVDQNDLALYSTLFETHDRSSLADFLEATIGPLLAHDRRRRATLAATMLCYFDHHQNAKTTAGRLGIHVNTVRQRLATIEALVGPWSRASRALEIHIALRLWHLGTPPD